MRGVNAIAFVALIAGCAAPVRTTEVGHPERAPRGYEATPRRLANLKRIAARDLNCPLPGVLVSEVNWQVWRTEGCGRIEHYAITRRGRGRYSSARWHPMIHVSVRAQDALGCPSGVRVHERRLDRFEVVGCGHRAVMRLRCTLEGCGWFALERPERVAQQGASPPASGSATSGTVTNGTATTHGTEANDGTVPAPPGEGAAALDGPSNGTTPFTADERASAPTPDAEASVRRRIDEHRDEVVACFGGQTPITIHARWDRGMVRFSSEPEDPGRSGCLNHVLRGLGLAGSGHVIHVVQ